jgi:hypothetical protein
MSARRKLNGASSMGSLMIAGLVGLAATFVGVFLLTLGALTAIELVARNIRPGGRDR